MRIRRILACSISVLMLAATVASPADAGGLNTGMCEHQSDRVEVPDDFVIEVCFDGENIYFRNDSSVLIRVTSPDGTRGATRYGITSLTSAIVSATADAEVLATDVWLSVPVTTAGATFTIVGEPGLSQVHALALTIERFVPIDAIGHAGALADFVNEVVTVTEDLQICLAKSSWITDGGCWLGWDWDMNVAVGRLAVKTGFTLVGGVIGAVKALLDTSGYISDGVDDVGEFVQGSKTLTITVADQLVDISDPNVAWDRIKDAEIPGLCMHQPTRLSDGVDLDPSRSNEHPGGNPGFLELIRSSLVTGLSSPDGPLIVVAAECSAGGVGWDPPVMFFTTDGLYHTSTHLWPADWQSVGLTGPARGGAALRVDGSRLYVDIAAYVEGDAGCCASGEALVGIEVAADGALEFVSIENTSEVIASSQPQAASPDCSDPNSATCQARQATQRFLDAVNRHDRQVAVALAAPAVLNEFDNWWNWDSTIDELVLVGDPACYGAGGGIVECYATLSEPSFVAYRFLLAVRGSEWSVTEFEFIHTS